MGCVSSTVPPPSEGAVKEVTPTPAPTAVATVEAIVPTFVRTILNHSRVLEDEYILGKQLGKYVCTTPSLLTAHDTVATCLAKAQYTLH